MVVKYDSIGDVPEHLQEAASRFVSSLTDDTFVIRNLPSELTGGIMARYSRAKTGLRLTMINEFLDENGNPSQEKGSALMDRVLNAYGDESVGELEGAHVGLENVTNLITKEVEDKRIGGSPIEQSTRYVMYDQKDPSGGWRYFTPSEVKLDPKLQTIYTQIMDHAFETYAELIPKLKALFKGIYPREKHTITIGKGDDIQVLHEKDLSTTDEEKAFNISYNFAVRCAALDVGRCVLPASTLTHVGLYGNGRFYTNLITHLNSIPLQEGHEKGMQLAEALDTEIPTFVKRHRVDSRRPKVDASITRWARILFNDIKPTDDFVELVYRGDRLDETVAACLFPYTNLSLTQIMRKMTQLSYETKRRVVDDYTDYRESRRDRPGRGLEAGYPYTFDLVGCFAEYRDLQRHRMLTQQRQPFGVDLGFILPPEVTEVGMENAVLDVEASMRGLNHELNSELGKPLSQYATLFNHRIRWYMGMNLREVEHLTELRTQPAGHPSYRRMAMEMATQVLDEEPWAENALRFVNYSDPDNKISRATEQSRIAGKNLAAGIDGGMDYE